MANRFHRVARGLCLASLCVALLVRSAVPATAASPGVVVAAAGGKDTPLFQQWQTFRRNVDDKSGGSLLLDYLIFGELGSQQSMLQAVMTGRASIGGFSCGGITQTIPELAVPQMPFLFTSQEQADYVFERFLAPIYSEILAQHGLVLLRWSDNGFMDIYAKEPVAVPTQLLGKQVRTVNNIAGPVLLEAIRAIPVEVGVSEIASSAQADKLFGGMGNLQNYAQLQPIFHYYTQTHHAFNCGVVVANKAWFESATPQEQEILRASYPMPAATARSLQARNKSLAAQFAAKGTVFLTLSPEEHNAWEAVGLLLYPTILERAGGRSIEIYDLIRAGKQAYLREPAPIERH